jgi:hypothetical protein
MRPMLFVCSLLAASVLMTGSALAGPAPSPTVAQKVDKCVKDKNGIVRCDLSGSDIPGFLQTPEGGIIGAGLRPTFASLIDYRQSFLSEFDKTVDEL